MNDLLDSRQLKALIVLAKTGSVTETAGQLFVTHSAISHSFRNLEAQVGCRLFGKLGKKVILTEAGEALLAHAERILSEMRQAQVTLTDLNKWGSRRLRLAIESIFPSDFIAPVLLKFRREFPATVIHVETCPADQAADLLDNRAVDLVLAAKPSSGKNHEFLPLLADRFHLVVNPGHPLAAKSNLTRKDLTQHPCLLLRGCGHQRMALENLLYQRGLNLNITAEIEHLETIKNFVKNTHAAGLLPGWVITSELRNRWLISLRLSKKPIEQSWGLLHSRARPLNHAESTLWKYCGQQIASLS